MHIIAQFSGTASAIKQLVIFLNVIIKKNIYIYIYIYIYILSVYVHAADIMWNHRHSSNNVQYVLILYDGDSRACIAVKIDILFLKKRI